MCECYKEGLMIMNGNLASTLCKYDLRKHDLFLLSWARVRREGGKYIFRAANV